MGEILIGVSACLLSEQVRYDGGHKRNAFLLEQLAPHVRFVPVCPELGIGLGVPRESIRLVRRGDRVRLLGAANVGHTDAMRRWAATVMDELRERDLSGFVLKRGSPSGGLERVRVWDEGLKRPARGVFAQALVEAMPALAISAFLAFVVSVVLWFTDSRQEALFTGLWVPSILALGGFYAALRRHST